MAKWVICAGPDWFRPSVASTKQLMNKFYGDGYYILWVNPIAFKSAGINSISKKSLYNKIKNKFFTHLKIFTKCDKNFYVLVPFYLPVFKPWAEIFNKNIVQLQYNTVRIILGIKRTSGILWIAGSFTLMKEIRKTYFKKIYQAGDFVSDFRTHDKSLKIKLLKKEAELCNNSDLIFAASKNIRQKLQDITSNEVYLLLHGVDFNNFNRKQNEPEIMKIIKAKGLPIAGYFGSLSDANNKKVLSALAENNFSVVIIGKILGDYSELINKENIYFLGPIKYEQIPSFGQYFDICLMNWLPSAWIDNCFPIKSLEYLAMGKPVISVYIPIIAELFGEIVYFANSPEEFVTKARLALQENNQCLIDRRIAAVRNYDWSHKYKYVKSRILNEQI